MIASVLQALYGSTKIIVSLRDGTNWEGVLNTRVDADDIIVLDTQSFGAVVLSRDFIVSIRNKLI